MENDLEFYEDNLMTIDKGYHGLRCNDSFFFELWEDSLELSHFYEIRITIPSIIIHIGRFDYFKSKSIFLFISNDMLYN